MGCIVLSALSAGSYRIGWIVSLDRIGIGWIGLDSIVPYRIVSYRLDEYTSAFMHWLVTARMGRMGRMDWMGSWWDGGGTDRR